MTRSLYCGQIGQPQTSAPHPNKRGRRSSFQTGYGLSETTHRKSLAPCQVRPGSMKKRRSRGLTDTRTDTHLQALVFLTHFYGFTRVSVIKKKSIYFILYLAFINLSQKQEVTGELAMGDCLKRQGTCREKGCPWTGQVRPRAGISGKRQASTAFVGGRQLLQRVMLEITFPSHGHTNKQRK